MGLNFLAVSDAHKLGAIKAIINKAAHYPISSATHVGAATAAIKLDHLSTLHQLQRVALAESNYETLKYVEY